MRLHKELEMKHFDDFDKEFKRMNKFINAWFIFVAVIMLAMLGGVGFVVFKLLEYFGIL
jgi:hypothetical protein